MAQTYNILALMIHLPPNSPIAPVLNPQEFARFQELIYKIAGIRMADSKQVLLAGRLSRRLRTLNLPTFAEYYQLVTHPSQTSELQTMVDLLTTNETYFFREKAHFDFLANTIVTGHPKGTPLDIWSAASSTGEEIYTLSFVLNDCLGPLGKWSVTGSDLCTTVLETAARGRYLLDRTRGLPPDYLRKYCTRHSGADDGWFTINDDIKRHTRFLQVNLNKTLPSGLAKYHVIFLRNVMIYFDADTKRQVVARLIERLLPGGYLIIGHSESLTGLTDRLKNVKPTIFQLPA
jgi:chemotaxis protein methyltransferase CheR